MYEYERSQRDRIRERVQRIKGRVDPMLTRFGFAPSFRLDEHVHLYTTCQRCGSLLVVTSNDDAVAAHWRRHHRVRNALIEALLWVGTKVCPQRER